MTSATNDHVFDLIHAAILKLRDMEAIRDADSLELNEAYALLIEARGLVRPVSLVQKPGYVLCPGAYAGTFQRLAPGVGKCRHCKSEQRIIMYGKHLRNHYVPVLPDEAPPTRSLLRGSLAVSNTPNYNWPEGKPWTLQDTLNSEAGRSKSVPATEPAVMPTDACGFCQCPIGLHTADGCQCEDSEGHPDTLACVDSDCYCTCTLDSEAGRGSKSDVVRQSGRPLSDSDVSNVPNSNWPEGRPWTLEDTLNSERR